MKIDLFNQIFAKDFALDEAKWRGPFDFVDRDSDNLFVTIGDSWTYGWRLDEEVDTNKQQFRIDNCYGGIISDRFGHDFLNLSIPAANNLWMAQKYQQLADNFETLDYQQITVFITLTEYGREFFTDFENAVPEIFDRYNRCRSAVDVARAISAQVACMISQPSRIRLHTGINYVSNLYPTTMKMLDRTWLEVLKDRSIDEFCCTVGSWVIQKFEQLLKIDPALDRILLMQELDTMIDQSLKRLDLIYNTGYNHKVGYGHPNAQGHALWANYILQSVKLD